MSAFRRFLDRIMLLDLFAGLGITFKHLFKKNVTIQYPEARMEPTHRLRGMFRLDEDRCIKCTICARDCPIDIIYIRDHTEVEEVEGSGETKEESTIGEPFTQIDEQLERVFGHDDRKRVTATRSYPWRTICKLEITAANGRSFGCSGALIGPRTVLTNGHCVYMHDHGGWARRIRVSPGMSGSARPYGYADSSFYHSVKGWTQSRSSNYDYAVIVLPSNKKLGNSVGWMGLANLSFFSLMGLRVNNSGYPGDKPFGTQWWNANNVLAVTSRRVYYRLDTYNGQSGSPVWRYRNGKRHIIAVHNTGGAVFNGSVRIVKPVFNNLVKWKNAYT